MMAVNEGTRQFEDIEVRRENGVQTIELNRPERLNALTYPMLEEITTAASLAADDPTVRVVVLRGAGRSFCAGDSLKGMGELPESVDALQRFDEYGYFSPIRALRELSKPVIAAVHGHALGAGCELAMAADIRVVHLEAQVGIPFVRLALAGGTYQLPRLVGLTRAVELLFSGRSMDGREALQEGWATEVAEDEAALEAAVARWTDHLRSAPTGAIGLMKRAVYHAFEDDLVEGFHRVALNQIVTVGSHDREEGRQAWLERRPPSFRGY
jgi:enoyl-CoA hydratase/carnithine racemase